MIAGYAVTNGKLRQLSDIAAQKDEAVWIDLLRPTEEEEKTLEAALGFDIPTRAEMEEIEVSSRLYVYEGATYMTALVPSGTDKGQPVVSPVTFALEGARLLTIRYEDPRVFSAFAARAQKASLGCASADAVLISLLEAIIDRLADILEHAASDADRISVEIFIKPGANLSRPRDFQRVLIELGRAGDLVSKIRDSLGTFERLIGFLILTIDQRLSVDKKAARDLKARLKTASRDVGSLTDHVSFVSQKITFLLDATLGLINIEQNQIIKIFSIAAVSFMPPTLIASIYGMNFEFMPELSSPYGYPVAIGAMLLSAVLPLLYFKKRGWL